MVNSITLMLRLGNDVGDFFLFLFLFRYVLSLLFERDAVT